MAKAKKIKKSQSIMQYKLKQYNKMFKNPTFVLTLPLKATISDRAALNKYFELSRKLYNTLLGESLKRLNLMRESKQYKNIKLIADHKERSEAYNNIKTKYRFTEFDIIKYSTCLRVNEFKQIDANTVQNLASRAFDAVNKIMLGKAKKVYFKRLNELHSISGTSNRQGIKYRDGSLIWSKLNILVLIKKKDDYAKMCLEYPIKYCAIKKEIIKGKDVFYIQVYFKGTPPVKLDREGNLKHKLGTGEVGIDIGTSTIAYVTDKECGLKELAKGIENIEGIKRKLSRKLDRQRRANNPNKYNLDGTINVKNKNKWIKSKNYIKTQNKLKNIQRKQSAIRKQKHEEIANYILSLGNIIKVELMQFQALQKKTKRTTKNSKGKFNKKKRFGKSLANKAPGMLLDILNRKLNYQNLYLFEINTSKVKASQYNHINNNYKKKNLSERWNCFNINNKEIKIQRDLYSSFLIKNVIIDEKLNLDKIDRDKCLSDFDNFKILHDEEIERLITLQNNKKLLSSMGI